MEGMGGQRKGGKGQEVFGGGRGRREGGGGGGGVGQKEEWEKGRGEEDERRMGVVWSVCTGGNS